MIKKLQYYIGSCTDPHRNLALEEYLTDTVGEDTCILYLWQNKHTVVIGRNQNAWQECRTTELERDSGTLACRLSGGGAVYHDMGNLNFTFSLRTQDYDLRKQQSVIVEACRSLGIPAEISGRNDILTNGCKFSGNSFYSHAGCSFHNGTLLVNVDMANLGKYLTPSKTKLESKGVASVRSRVINLTELKPDLTIDGMAQAMVQAFETVYGLEAQELREAVQDDTNIDEELGDLLFAAVRVASTLDKDPEQALHSACEKFIKRFTAMEQSILASGRTLEELSREELLASWDAQKRNGR